MDLVSLTPRENPYFFGHQGVEQQVLTAMAQEKFPHALLLQGPQGVGKATFAFRLARFLLAHGKDSIPQSAHLEVDSTSPLFRRIAAGSHADLFTLARVPGKEGALPKFITVDDVRAAIAFSRKTPAEGGWRIVILDSADDLNKNAANALLKLLEEPPERSLIILTASMPGRLPVTLLSRCQKLAFDSLSPDEVAQVYTAQNRDHPSAALMALGAGAPGRMMALEKEGGVEIYGKVQSLLAQAFQGQGMRAVMGLQKYLDQKPEAIQMLLSMLSGYSRQIMTYLTQDQSVLTPDEVATLRHLKKEDLGHWMNIWQKIQGFHRQAQIFNLDWRQTLEGIVHLIESPR